MSSDQGFFGSFQSALGSLVVGVSPATQPETSNQPPTAPVLTIPSSNSRSWSAKDEKEGNSFIKALAPGGILERAALFRRPFNGVFVPRQARLEELQITKLLETAPNPHYVYDESAPPASARAQLIKDGDGLFDPSLVLRVPHEDARCREFLALFLEHHIALFDSFGLAQTFGLSCGIRGSLTECLDQISVSGRTSKIHIQAHISPAAESVIGSGGGKPNDPEHTPASSNPDALNIFVIEDTIMDAYDLKKYIAQILTAQQQQQQSASKRHHVGDGANPAANSKTIATVDGLSSTPALGSANLTSIAVQQQQQLNSRNASNERARSASMAKPLPAANTTAEKSEESRGGLGKFISELFGGSSKQITSAVTETAAAVQATQSQFQRFQQKMQRSESRYLARSVTAFIEYCNGTSSISSAAHSAGPPGGGHPMGVANKNKPISGKEVKSVVDQLMQQVREIKEWQGMEDVAIEGFEKYIMTKIYARTFCFTDEEKMESRRFENRLKAFSTVVSEETFELVPHLVDRAQWRQAIVELNAMSDYKCPRDKLVCGMNACRLLIRALEVAARIHEHQLECVRNGTSPNTPVPISGAGAPSSIGSADVFLPALFLCLAKASPVLYLANVRYIDKYRHRSLVDNESGYLLTCLMAAVEFWQSATADQLGLSQEVFNAASKRERELNEREDWSAVTASQPAHYRRPQSPAPSLAQPQQVSSASSQLPRQSSTVSPNPPARAVTPQQVLPKPTPPSTASPAPSATSASHTDPFDTFFSATSPPSATVQQQSGNGATEKRSPSPHVPDVSLLAAKGNPVASTSATNLPPPPASESLKQEEGGAPAAVIAHSPDGQLSPPAFFSPISNASASVQPNTGPLVGGGGGSAAAASADATNEAFKKLEVCGGSIDALTVAELKLIALEALRLRKAQQ